MIGCPRDPGLPVSRPRWCSLGHHARADRCFSNATTFGLSRLTGSIRGSAPGTLGRTSSRCLRTATQPSRLIDESISDPSANLYLWRGRRGFLNTGQYFRQDDSRQPSRLFIPRCVVSVNGINDLRDTQPYSQFRLSNYRETPDVCLRNAWRCPQSATWISIFLTSFQCGQRKVNIRSATRSRRNYPDEQGAPSCPSPIISGGTGLCKMHPRQ